MKRVNKHLLLFACAFLFLATGFSKDYFQQMRHTLERLVYDIRTHDSEGITRFIGQVDSNASELLSYHYGLLNINSIRDNLLNTRIIIKDDETILKTHSESLIPLRGEPLSDAKLSDIVTSVSNIYSTTQETGGQFLYIATPVKGVFCSAPENVTDYSAYNYEKLVCALKDQSVPVLDLAEEMRKEGLATEDAFFRTDHHWKPSTGFGVANTICSELRDRYGFSFDPCFCDISNYTVTTYKNWFLGSYGKKTGLYYTDGGADDIDLILPAFETQLTELQPLKNTSRSGAFDETVIYQENILEKDFYALNPYAAYSGGDFRLQIIRNHQNPNGKTAVIIRNSFACVVTPFLSLNLSELHLLDNRDYIFGEPINVHEYIRKIQPDYVLILCVGTNVIDEGTEK